ncbi:hypothetical protein [uncultured Microbacterium sp.]|uniref:Protein TPRXL n=1 Tax=uncultured Microbacterium sp. TaxID=191216 RepID=A0A1Y5P4R5_9MICO|nr:hypothetical protein [uncultured Microbacterium sp.]SBS73675.1 conserved hypothetical protein [uncultured Microbacterium sp.]
MNDAAATDDPLQSTPERVSLRESLGAAGPGFDLALPTGWVRREATAGQRDEMVAAVRGRLLQAHRPDLFARVRPLLDDAFQQMAQASVIAFFTPATGDDEALALPASLVASIRTPTTPGGTLDPLVQALVREAGATPLLGDTRFLRFERESRQRLEDTDFLSTQIVYLTPIPGTRRRRGLQLTATIARPLDTPADDRPLVLIRTLLDLSVSSLTWTAPAQTAGRP